MPVTTRLKRKHEEHLLDVERKKTRLEKFPGPQPMLGEYLNAQVEEDVRRVMLKHLDDKALMNACLVSKGALTATSSREEVVERIVAAQELIIKENAKETDLLEGFFQRIAKDLNLWLRHSPELVAAMTSIVSHIVANSELARHFNELSYSLKSMRCQKWMYLALKGGDAMEKMCELANELEKEKNAAIPIKEQADGIEALTRLLHEYQENDEASCARLPELLLARLLQLIRNALN